jgi:hypothetical protein
MLRGRVLNGRPTFINGSLMEIVIVVLFVACAIWLVTKIWKRENDASDASVARAWRIVLSDPNYNNRRPLEERKYAAIGQ